MNNYDIVVYRVDSTKGQGNDSWAKDIRFFTDTLDYFDHSDTGYSRQDAKKYLLNIKDFKVFDPMKEWKDELSVNTGSDIRCSEEFAIEKDLIIADYLDDIDYDDSDEYHEVLIDTDSLAMYGRDNGYDVTIIRDIPSEGGSGEEFTEYAVHNSRCVKIVNAMSFNRNSDNITEDMNGPITDKIIDKLNEMGYNIHNIQSGWYNDSGEPIKDSEWENREEPEDDWYYVEESYYLCKSDSNQVSFSWRTDESRKEFTVVGLYGNYKKSTQGFATKTLESCLEIIPHDWTILVENNINSGYWNHMKDKHKEHNWKDVYESLNEELDIDSLPNNRDERYEVLFKELVDSGRVSGNYIMLRWNYWENSRRLQFLKSYYPDEVLYINKRPTTKREPVVYLYRGTSERSFSKKYDKVAGIFFSIKRQYVTGWGEVKKYILKKEAKIYQGDASSDEFVGSDYFNKKYPEIQKYFGMYFSKPIQTIKEISDIFDNDKERKELDDKVVELCGDNFCNYDVWTWCDQLVARIELEKQGYDGAKWTHEDFGNPVQYQIWNLDVLKSSDGVVEDFTQGQALSSFYDKELQNQLKQINNFLDKYGFEVELVDDEDLIQEMKDSNSAGMFFGSIQDNASVFPIALNKEMICNESEDTTDIHYGIVGTLVHEVGHGIFRYCNDVLDLDDLDEEGVVEEFARDYEDGLLDDNELMNIIKQTLKEDLTKGQEEFFKDSKVRDENGNLLVCYHGTHTPGFKEFDASKGNSKFGDYKFNKNLYSSYNVNYFTTDRKSAASYTELGYEKDNNVYACYINIVNPYVVNNKTEKDMRSSFNIKDDGLRQHQIELFDNIWNKWNDKVTWNYSSEEDFDSSELEELNDDLRKLNLELREDGEYYSLYTLGNNSMYGQEHPIEPQYTIIELFDDDMYDQLKEDVLGISDEYGDDDYYFSTDDVVRYVLSLNETKGTDYDGIIIPDIIDSMDMFSLRGTDVITLKSSNQIKLINNENPTSSNRVDETYESNEFKLGTAGYIKEDGTFIYVDDYHGEEPSLRDSKLPEFSNTHYEEDTCVRIYKEPNEIQYSKLEDIIDRYLDSEMYCKVEIWENHSKYNYYEIFSLYEGACRDIGWEEKVGNWTGYDLVQKIKNYFKGKLRESLLLEKTRQELINKSKNADNYKDQSKGKNRYERRLKSRIANSVAQYNKIDMDAFFKRDILTVGIDVQGETDNYVVTMRFNGVLKEIQRDVKGNNGKLEFKIIARAMSRVYNSGDVRLHCTCPDWKYRQAYWADKGGYGTQYEPRPSDITNPKDSKGGGCKHSLLVMGNLDWMMKVSSVINNYIKYCQNNLQNNYATYMFPKIYGMPYNKAVQLSLFDTGLLPSDQETLTTVATTNLKDKDAKGRWIGGNSYRFKSTKPQLKTPEVDDKDTNKFELQKDRNGKPVLTYDLGNGRNTLGRFSKGNQFAKKSPNLDSKKQEQDVKGPEVTDTKKKQLSIFDDEEEI